LKSVDIILHNLQHFVVRSLYHFSWHGIHFWSCIRSWVIPKDVHDDDR